ncbi:hypothetical protein [Sphingosinicella sp. CPCC 101087]|uniref:hypothetical protein n=1 Tax=Sphingosinicella sp. CPCC 101087 TaxID=2497754 RepID=UPI00101C5597|nr:hypothetical protein [Sphingosinicella sp. CPCC 101087]
MTWLAGFEEVAIYVVIGVALLAGLAASYGRELEAGRRVERGWWIRRLLILPLLAIAAMAGTDMLDLSSSATAFGAAMLSLGGYDALRVLEARWKLKTSAGDATRVQGESR